MDLRVVKTKKAIRDAFLQIRERTELERVKVKEICDIALINKTTFYKYYKDVSDLSEALEEEIMDDITKELVDKANFVNESKAFISNMPIILDKHKKELQPLYSGRFHVLINSLEERIISYYASTPDNIEDEFKLTFMICGVFETIKRAKIKDKYSDETIIEQTSELVERVKTQKLL